MIRLHNDPYRKDCVYCGGPSSYPQSAYLLPVCRQCEENNNGPSPYEVVMALIEGD
jgi:hypothetical protein